MKFEVVGKDGKAVMSTVYLSQIPPNNHLDSLTEAGYTFRIDGKKMSKNKVKDYVKQALEDKNE